MKISLLLIILTLSIQLYSQSDNTKQEYSTARVWMDAYLETIKKDGLGPTIQARNMYHIAATMYDTWIIYNPDKGQPLFLNKTIDGFSFKIDTFQIPENKDSAMFVSISYAAFRLMERRINNYSSKVRTLDDLIFLMEDLGLDPTFRGDDYSTGSPAALGNYLANQVFEFGLTESAGDEDGYEGYGFNSVNPPLKPNKPGNKNIIDVNRWQPLSVTDYIKKKGWDSTLLDWNFLLILPFDEFLTPHWGEQTPFAMTASDKKIKKNNGQEFTVYNDPGEPALVSKIGKHYSMEAYRWNHTLVASWSGHTDPNDKTLIDISPSGIGPTNGLLPNSLEEYQRFFDFKQGGTNSKPSKKNPYTGKKYQPNWVKRGDYTRVIAEYWVDAVNTYSPPGHWMKMLNDVSDHELFVKKWQGKGKTLNKLEWDIKSYLSLTGALHDAAISAWSIKAYYDYIRPISALRWMSDMGQCSDSLLPRYHQAGLPLIKDQIEMVKANDPLVGKSQEHINKIKMKVWRGPDFVYDVKANIAGVSWILAENWWPYQRYSFATPPFAGYVSGHSTFSIAASEILSLITGSSYFPGGIAELTIKKNHFLEFEKGPSQDITLQWATYREAADETCLSRIWGGIHPPVDDIEGRKIGKKVAEQSFKFANQIFNSAE